MRILVTGGAGYIGSHTSLELLAAGHDVVIVDNLVNGSLAAVERLGALAGRVVPCHVMDVSDQTALRALFAAEHFDAVFHFAALKAVAESIEQPLRYYANNVAAVIGLAQVMAESDVRTLVFSSSATVYGLPEQMPVTEAAPLSAVNPYGRSKIIVEDILRDLQNAWPAFRVALLRYFNPGGAHVSGRIGESPHDRPNNLMPFVSQVALGTRPLLEIFGGDYATPDGTGVRDYIHVVDLARGHIAALDVLAEADGLYCDGGVLTVNLGTGRGYSVLEVVRAFERASGRPIRYEIVARRPGDVATCYADATLARQLLGWRSEYDLDRICADAWRWQQANPHGYGTAGSSDITPPGARSALPAKAQ